MKGTNVSSSKRKKRTKEKINKNQSQKIGIEWRVIIKQNEINQVKKKKR